MISFCKFTQPFCHADESGEVTFVGPESTLDAFEFLCYFCHRVNFGCNLHVVVNLLSPGGEERLTANRACRKCGSKRAFPSLEMKFGLSCLVSSRVFVPLLLLLEEVEFIGSQSEKKKVKNEDF